MRIEISKKGLVQIGKWTSAALALSVFTYFLIQFALFAFAYQVTISEQFSNVSFNTTIATRNNISANGTFVRNLTFTVAITSMNATNITIIVPGYTTNDTSRGNYTVFLENVGAWASTNNTNFNVSVRQNFSQPSNSVRVIEVTNTTTTILTSGNAINITLFNITSAVNTTGHNINNTWTIQVRHDAAVDDTNMSDITLHTYVDSQVPNIDAVVPIPSGYVKGVANQNFSMAMNETNLNTSNVTLRWRIQGAPSYSVVNSSTNGEIICSSGVNFTCGVNLRLSGNATENDVIEFYWEATDIVKNFNNRGTSASPLKTTVDTTAPTISNVGEPDDTQEYAPNKNYTFVATITDNKEVGTVRLENNFTSDGTFLNTTVSNISSSFYAVNFTNIGVGVYAVRWFADDLVLPGADTNVASTTNASGSNNRNTFYIRTNTTNLINFFLNGTAFSNLTLTYPAQVNVTAVPLYNSQGQGHTSTGSVSIFRNNVTNVTNQNDTNFRLGNGTYEYIANITGGTNYTSNSTRLFAVTVQKGNITLELGLNGTTANRTYVYPQFINATANITNNITTMIIDQYNLSLYRDNVIVASTTTGVSLTEALRLGNSTNPYNYTVVFNGSTNYTDISLVNLRFARILKGGTSITLLVNDSAANFTIKSAQGVNISVELNTTETGLEGTLYLDRNQTNENATTTLRSFNRTDLTFIGPGSRSFNITGFYNETASNSNYTNSSATFFVLIESTAPQFSGGLSNVTNNTIIGRDTADVNVSFNWTDNFELDSWIVEHNGTGTTWNASTQILRASGAGNTNSSNFSIDVNTSFTLSGFWYARIYANDTSGNSNVSDRFWFTTDGTAPQIFNVNPANFTYINGTANQNFSVRVVDDTLNTTNATLHRRIKGATAWTNTSLTCVQSGTTYTCSALIDLSAQPSNRTIEYYFDASDNSNIGNTSAGATNPYNVTIDRENPKPINVLQRNVETNITIVRGASVNFSVRWVDNLNLSYAVLETNETGAAINYTNRYASPANFTGGGEAQWSNFSWSNATLIAGTGISWRVYANDTFGNTYLTDNTSFMVTIESGAPQVLVNTTNVTNNTIITRQDNINISANWANGIELQYWWVQHNFTSDSSLTNVSFERFLTAALNNSNFTINVTVAVPGSLRGARIFANDTSGIQNNTGFFTWTIDGTLPTPVVPPGEDPSTNVTNNTIITNDDNINITADWTDLELSDWLVEHNFTSGGTFTNTSAEKFLTAGLNNSNFTINVSSALKGRLLAARIIATDTSGNTNATKFLFWTIDNTIPAPSGYTTNVTNNTVTARNSSTYLNISGNWSDLELDSWLVEYNGTGTVTNTSAEKFLTAGLNFSNYTINITSSFTSGIWFARIYAIDTSGNSNVTESFWFSSDSTPPTISTLTEPSEPQEYAPDKNYTIGVNVTDNVGIYNVLLENNFTSGGAFQNTTATVAFGATSFYAVNFTDIAAGTYGYRWFANDTSNNMAFTNNSTSGSGNRDYLTIRTNTTNPINFFLNSTAFSNLTLTYPAQVNVTAWPLYQNATPSHTSIGSLSIFRNNVTNVTSENATNVRLGNGTYEYLANITGGTNYTSNSTRLFAVTVQKGNITLRLELNATEANSTYVFPQAINATASISNNITTLAIDQYNLSLYRNNTIVASTTTGVVTSQVVQIVPATYNYTVVFNGSTNYTDISIFDNRFAILNQGGINVTLQLNDTSANRTYIYPQLLNATAARNSTSFTTINISLFRNNTIVNSSTSELSIFEHTRLAVALYNYTVVVSGGGNYTDVSIVSVRNADITAGSTNITLVIANNQSNIAIEQGVSVNFTATINTTIDNVSLSLALNISGWPTNTSTAVSPEVRNTTATSGLTAANSYNVTAFFNATANYSGSSRTFFLNITQDVTAPTIRIFYQNGTSYGNKSINKSSDIVRFNVTVNDSGVGMASNQNVSVFIGGVFAGNITLTSSGQYNGNVTVPSAANVGADGDKTITMNISDINGNIGTNSSFVITIDNTVPTITISTPTNASYVKGDSSGFIWINGTIFDNIEMGPVGYNVTINGTTFGIFNFTGVNNSAFAIRNSSAVPENVVNFTISYNDSSNNTGRNSSILFFVDNTAPSTVVGLTNSSSGTKYAPNSSQTVQVLVVDNLQTNRTITLYYKYPGKNSPWNTTLMTGTPETSTSYSATIDTSELVSNQSVSYYITGVDNATNSLVASIGGSASSPLGRIMIEVNTTGAIDGYVVANDTGSGVSDATVSTNQGAAVSTSDGYYKISNLPLGTYTLTTTKSGWITNTTSGVSATAGTTTRQNITLPNNNTGTIQGYVRSNDTTPVLLVSAVVTDATRAAITNVDGFYQISGVPGGVYTLNVSKTDYISNSTTNVVVSPGGTTNVNLSMANNATGSIAGYVYLTNTSATVPNSSVRVTDGDRTDWTTNLGHYLITGVPAGTYTLTVGGTNGYWTNTTTATVSAGATTTVNTRVTGAESFNVTLPGTSGSSLTGFWEPGWHDFFLATRTFADGTNTTLPTVVSSISRNYTIIYRYNATTQTWASFVEGATANTFTSIASSDDHYWIYINVTDRFEVERRY